ncbi:Hypothetical predicted protein [Podarcis lilfordi]|uniref:Uncharacterized protein n=1 Tax=Podarcis lilfordi TaxID=74358 RepID=A0AA35P0R0_9SAUR|nr:Hypothetical predicted protein [Podarcis lilfordi]
MAELAAGAVFAASRPRSAILKAQLAASGFHVRGLRFANRGNGLRAELSLARLLEPRRRRRKSLNPPGGARAILSNGISRLFECGLSRGRSSPRGHPDLRHARVSGNLM